MVVYFHNFHRLRRHRCLWIPTLQLITTTVIVDHADEGLFSKEEYSENSNRNDDEQSSSLGMLMKSERQQRKCITAFASGTGLAGIVGYAYKSLLAELFGWGLSYIVWSAILLSIAYYRIFCTGLYDMEIRLEAVQSRVNDENVYSYSSAEKKRQS